jgi:predicted phage terminase large subunit-like protein
MTVIKLRPQKGPQEQFLSSSADIVIYGGGAGGGKSWSLLLEALRGVHNPQFNAVLFRRTFPQIRNPGGLWDASGAIYPLVGGVPKESKLQWDFKSGAYLVMRHLKLESDVYGWQGSELVYIGFDELTHFTESQFWYLLSRARSTCGIRPYIRATCNPVHGDDPVGGWVRRLIDWWIGEDGLPIPERSGVIKFLRRSGAELEWFDEPVQGSKSLTFIPSTVHDNPALLEKDPDYLANLMVLPWVERQRLLGGNWNIKPVAGTLFKREWLPVVAMPQQFQKAVCFWDFATSFDQKNADWCVAVKMVQVGDQFVIPQVFRFRATPAQLEKELIRVARLVNCPIRYFRDPGQAGLYQDAKVRQVLAGFDVSGLLSPVSKLDRAMPLARAVEFGQVGLVAGDWNGSMLTELESFPDGAYDDQVDAAAGAYAYLTGSPVLRQPPSTGQFRA